VLVSGGGDARYLPTGHLVYALGDTLFGVAFDARRLTVSGGPVPLVQGVLRSANGNTPAANFGVSRDGTLVYVSGAIAAPKNTLVWVNRDGREEAIDIPPRAYMYAQLSPDGKRVALDSRDEANDIWIFDLERATLQRLTFDVNPDRSPIWSPDGSRVAYAGAVEGVSGIYSQAADGAGGAELVAADTVITNFPTDFSSDGTALLYSVFVNDIGIQPLAPGAEARIFSTPANEYNPTVSPDGRWLAYQSDESGRFEIYVRPFPALDAGKWQVSTNGGTRPRWRRDGSELFYFNGGTASGEIVAVPIDAGETFSWQSPVPLFRGDYLAVQQSGRGTYDVTADGQRFLMIKAAEARATESTQIVIVENWLEEVKRLIPTP
jgi:serine/threonine-protein kinase